MPQIIINIPTECIYDAFGRMQQIVYPDGEVVNYNYRNGLLCSVTGDASMPYIRDISYDLYGNISYIQYGNGLQTNIFYDDVHLRPYNRQTYTGQDVPLQDISYTYDGVGNITRIYQSVDPFGNMGGTYDVRYTYDDQYRLTRAVQSSTQLGGYDYSMSYTPSGLVATKSCPETDTYLTYGYQHSSNNRVSPFASHRVATVFPTNTEDVALTVWNANGELTSIVQPFQDNFRRHLWNEAGQLAFFVSNEYCGYYAYDAQGNRAYKLTGMVVAYQYDAGTMQATAYFDDVTLYVNPYMVVTPRGYTKHYYNGSQRIAARLGGSWTKDSTFVQNQQWIAQAESLWETTTNTNDLDEQEILREDVYVGGNGSALPACQYSPNITQLSGYFSTNLLSSVFSGQASERTLTDTIGIYFYHPDHLGSANWITNSQGQAVQYIHYMPYGEVWVNQQTSRYDERFKFTGKERDTETGYDYFGARYYSPMIGHWLSPDPLANKYPNISPYAYCSWNPLKYVDPNGKSPLSPIMLGLTYYTTAKVMENCSGTNNVIREIGYAMQHPINALRTGSADVPAWGFSKIASNFQVNLQKGAGFSKGVGGQGNAFRHTLWQAMLTNAFGDKHAQRIGNAHENSIPADMTTRTFSNLDMADQMADMLNNEIGRSIGMFNEGADNKLMAEQVLREYKENGLWEVISNDNGGYDVKRVNLSTEQYEKTVQIVRQKGNNGLEQ